MASLNKVFLIGNLTRDPELRYTPSGTAVVGLRLAVNRRYKDKTGAMKEDTCFITVNAWDRQAEVCNQYLKKGSPIFVEGRLQSRSWDTQDGQKRSTIDIQAERVQFLSSGQGQSRNVEASPVSVMEEAPAPVTPSPSSEPEIKPENISWDEEENTV